jgi:undecaprenyl-diphosphatase
MTIFQAIIIGIVQGLTEFLPVSSTAHIRIVPALLGWEDPGAAFTAVIQFGTLVAVLIYFSKDIVNLTLAFFEGLKNKNPFGTLESRLAWYIIFGTLPVVFFGLLLQKHITGDFRSLYVIAGSMVVFALVLWGAEIVAKKTKAMKDITVGDSVFIGFAQACALVPGSSRSGTTITGGLFAGLNRETAARFSFLLSIPSVFAAGIKELVDERHTLLASSNDVAALVVSTVVSGVVGYLAIAFLLDYLKKHTTYLFIIYRIVVGTALLILLTMGILKP